MVPFQIPPPSASPERPSARMAFCDTSVFRRGRPPTLITPPPRAVTSPLPLARTWLPEITLLARASSRRGGSIAGVADHEAAAVQKQHGMQPFGTRPIHAHGQRARRTGRLDILDRVQLAGRPLKIQHRELVLADGFRR